MRERAENLQSPGNLSSFGSDVEPATAAEADGRNRCRGGAQAAFIGPRARLSTVARRPRGPWHRACTFLGAKGAMVNGGERG
jgi:hypothetical protein